MKVPSGLLDPQGKVAKGTFHLEANGEEVQEFGLTVTGSHSTCYALASPGDELTANFSLTSGISTEFADLVVDGILRNSWPNTRGTKVFQYIFDRAVYSGNLIGENKKIKSHKYAKMKVVERHTQTDLPKDSNQETSNVSSIKIQIYRKAKAAGSIAEAARALAIGETKDSDGPSNPRVAVQDASGSSDSGDDIPAKTLLPDPSPCQREPNYTQFPLWQDLNRRIDSGTTPPPFEIGFFDGLKHYQGARQKILKEYTGDYKLWASFTFLLRSTADLRALGFDDVPLHYSPVTVPTAILPVTVKASQAVNESGADQVRDSVEVLFTDEAEVIKKESAGEPLIKPKKSKKEKAKKSDELTKPKASKTAKEPETNPAPAPRATPEEHISRKTTDLVLLGLKSAPAQKAWERRGPTQEPEEETRNLEEPEKLSAISKSFIPRRSSVSNGSEPDHNTSSGSFSRRPSLVGLGVHYSPAIHPITQLETINKAHSESLGMSRVSSPTPSQAQTEIGTEVADPEDVEASGLSSQRVGATTLPNDSAISQVSLIPHHAKFLPDFNHTISSPVLGSSQVLEEVRVASPAAVQARLHWQTRTPQFESPRTPEIQRAMPADDPTTPTRSPALGRRKIFNCFPPIQSAPAILPSHNLLPSPPSTVLKRKADVMMDFEYKEERGNTQSEHQSPEHTANLEQQKATLLTEQAKVGPSVKDFAIQNEELSRKLEAEKNTVAACENGTNSQPRWEEELKRQNEAARARFAAAEIQRQELQTKYEAAMVIRKEREKVDEMNREAERLELENTQLQAAIAALYRGEEV